ncbi:hexokinase [Vairimorpha necatrix]|uniref:Hexokinase n=1 Tax=Vairimorpha necatrix TaxID=6039 RepID=A0AAX4JAR5_9MICR
MNSFLIFFISKIKMTLSSEPDYTIAEYSREDLESVFNQYKNTLSHNISNMSNLPNIKNTLVEDIHLNDQIISREHSVAVLDVGGSYFKIAMVKIKKNEEKFDLEISSVMSFPFPPMKKGIVMGWYNWVAEQYLNYMSKEEIVPDFASLIFSYPIEYKDDKIARPSILSKHWCFENKEILKSDLQTSLNNAITNKITKNQNFKNIFDKKEKFLVLSVLNDSVATFLSSKVIVEGEAVGVILGTGTNGAFTIKNNNKKYVYNTEWGAFKPENIKLIVEEEEFIKGIKTNYNYLDVLIGNGYKCGILNKIISTRKLDLFCVQGNSIANIMSRDDEDVYKKIVKGLINRSRQLIIALVCAVAANIESDQITILLNGSGYSETSERETFIEMLNQYAKEIFNIDADIKVVYKEGLTFYGAAYYSLVKYSNMKNLLNEL